MREKGAHPDPAGRRLISPAGEVGQGAALDRGHVNPLLPQTPVRVEPLQVAAVADHPSQVGALLHAIRLLLQES